MIFFRFLPSCVLTLTLMPGVLIGAEAQMEAAAVQQQGASAGGGSSSAELAQQLTNPVADLISFPIQGNVDFGIGPEDAIRSVTNVQPVIPIQLSEDWNLISRTILPVIYAEGVVPGMDDTFGIGDVLQSLFFSPSESDPIWGIGPAMLFPTASDDVLGLDRWAAGPTGVVLKQEGPITYGALANHLWDFAGSGSAVVNSTFLQPFFAYTTPGAWTFTVNSETSYNWDNGDWTIPIHFIVSKTITLGSQPIQIFGGIRYYAEAPDNGPEWGLRLGVTLLFPAG